MLHLGERECATIQNYRENVPGRGSPRDGGSAETLSAKRGTGRFAVMEEVLPVGYEPGSSRIFRSLTE
ncbi:MAG: hypothetical protein QOE55_5482 [Acidobacteriaceae bacterium]|jgi:hypothetical protein|nr:hypothetical protein [Acidobacteriaceae bacterium]